MTTAITTNRPFKEWPKVFPDALNAQVIAERLTERGEHFVLEIRIPTPRPQTLTEQLDLGPFQRPLGPLVAARRLTLGTGPFVAHQMVSPGTGETGGSETQRDRWR